MNADGKNYIILAFHGAVPDNSLPFEAWASLKLSSMRFFQQIAQSAEFWLPIVIGAWLLAMVETFLGNGFAERKETYSKGNSSLSSVRGTSLLHIMMRAQAFQRRSASSFP